MPQQSGQHSRVRSLVAAITFRLLFLSKIQIPQRGTVIGLGVLGHPDSQGQDFCDWQLHREIPAGRDLPECRRMLLPGASKTLTQGAALLTWPLPYGTQVTRSQFCFWDIRSLMLPGYPGALSDSVTLEGLPCLLGFSMPSKHTRQTFWEVSCGYY